MHQNLVKFNMALLSKQGLKILFRPSPLSYLRFLKCDALTVKLLLIQHSVVAAPCLVDPTSGAYTF